VPAVSQLEVQTDVNIIEFTEEEQATIMEAFPVSEFMIAADTYDDARGGRAVRVDVELRHRQLRSAGSFVYAVVDVVMSDNERMVNIHRAARSTLPENWDKNGVLMWHPGAARWFEENAGADIPDDMIHSAM
jgi:TRAP-type uncharacterized transport system substrate-binding protein